MAPFDTTDSSTVIVCDCGWREIANTRTQARSLLRDHADRTHRGDDIGTRLRATLNKADQRERRASNHDSTHSRG